MHYRDFLAQIAKADVDQLELKDREYGGSWLKRGGVGAFMMLARKWDRLETAVNRPRPVDDKVIDRYDVLGHAVNDGREEGILDDIGDLRRYLLLVEAEVRVRMGQDAPLVDPDFLRPSQLDPFRES